MEVYEYVPKFPIWKQHSAHSINCRMWLNIEENEFSYTYQVIANDLIRAIRKAFDDYPEQDNLFKFAKVATALDKQRIAAIEIGDVLYYPNWL